MHRLTPADPAFAKAFEAGAIPPANFDHMTHLRLAYVFLATHGPDKAPPVFREALPAYMTHHGSDPSKFHETLTQTWLKAVWLFMQRAGEELPFSARARPTFVPPDRDPIPPAPHDR